MAIGACIAILQNRNRLDLAALVLRLRHLPQMSLVSVDPGRTNANYKEKSSLRAICQRRFGALVPILPLAALISRPWFAAGGPGLRRQQSR